MQESWRSRRDLDPTAIAQVIRGAKDNMLMVRPYLTTAMVMMWLILLLPASPVITVELMVTLVLVSVVMVATVILPMQLVTLSTVLFASIPLTPATQRPWLPVVMLIFMWFVSSSGSLLSLPVLSAGFR